MGTGSGAEQLAAGGSQHALQLAIRPGHLTHASLALRLHAGVGAGQTIRVPDGRLIAEDRDDLVQEITTHLWLAWPKYDPARRFSTWMYRVALNVAISHVRLQSVRRQHAMASLDQDLHDIADPDTDTHEHAQQLHLLQQFIHRQPALDRALLLLYLDERLQREIADILGITEANVSTRIGRLKQRLRNEL